MASASGKLQNQLQSAVQSLRWTYSLYWRLCHEQGILVWGDGYYNGSIKTRKTVQPVEVSTEEASLQRSQQLWELYEFLSAGLETATQPAQPARRPCAALSPEDLTESEWFYLMCVSFSFPPGTGLPGKAFAEKRHVWMTRANEGDSKYFPRAILAKSAGIKTVLCIPLEDGVLELGSTEKVEEDTGLVRKARSFFAEQQEAVSMHRHHPPKPALSEHSTSDAVRGLMFHSPPLAMIHLPRIESLESNQKIDERDDDEDQDEDEDDDDEEEDEEEGGGFGPHVDATRDEACDAVATTINDSVERPTEASGLMQMEMSSDIRLGSPDDCSSNFSMDVPALAPLELDPNMVTGRASADKELKQTPGFHHPWASSLEAELSATPFTESTQEDAHYSHTVSTIMQHNANQMSESCCVGHLNWSPQSAFSGWSRIRAGDGRRQPVVASQYQLKYILFTLPFVYDRNGKVDGEGYEHRFPRFTSQDDLSASHVLAERRRREKLNERFVVLRSLVPFVTKMDKASILGDTIEYVKQLRRRIQELESGAKPVTAVEQRPKAPGTTKPPPATQANSAQVISPERSRFITAADRRKARALEGGASMARGVDGSSNYLEVSIIEADALLELQCPYREGLLLKIMQRLQELRIETTSVQSSSTIDDLFVAELRAKVKEDMHGKKASIIDVKKVIHQIFSSY